MPKARHPLSSAQLERHRAVAAKQKFWDRVSLLIFIVLLVAIVGFNIYTQIAHHP
jgi:hypothetical protein